MIRSRSVSNLALALDRDPLPDGNMGEMTPDCKFVKAGEILFSEGDFLDFIGPLEGH